MRRLPRRNPRCQLEENSFLSFANPAGSSSSLTRSSQRPFPIIMARTRTNPVGYSDENRNAIGM